MAEDNRRLGLLALEAAISRCHSAQQSENYSDFFSATAEAVWWATMLDETLWGETVDGKEYEAARASDPDGRLLLGLRYSRNRQVHDIGITGMQGNPLLKRGDGDGWEGWLWRDLADENIPQDFKPKEGHWGPIQESAYAEDLAKRPIVETLARSECFLRRCIDDVAF